jgi:DNA-binding HxlR family transcriptional regulator
MNRLSNLPLERALQVIGGRWKLLVVCHLEAGALRLSELERNVSGISQKVLIQQLRDLEEHGLVRRTVFPEVPARVEYALTALGYSLKPIIESLHLWGIEQGRALGDGDNLTICPRTQDMLGAAA